METPVSSKAAYHSCAPFFLLFLQFKCCLEVQHALGVLAIARALHVYMDLLTPGHCPHHLQAAGCSALRFGNEDMLGSSLQAVWEQLVKAKVCVIAK